MIFLLPYCSVANCWYFAALSIAHLPIYLHRKLKSASCNPIVYIVLTSCLFTFFFSITSRAILHHLGEYPVCKGMFNRNTLTIASVSLMVIALYLLYPGPKVLLPVVIFAFFPSCLEFLKLDLLHGAIVAFCLFCLFHHMGPLFDSCICVSWC